jgi:hypothetical protein
MNEHDSQACVFPFCMTGSATTGDENDVKADFPDFDSYYSTQLSSFFSLSSYTWNRVWTYRRLYCAGAISADSVYADDISMQNWYPGNDYPYGSILLDHADAAAQASDWCGGLDLTQVAQAEKHAVAFYFYMKSHRTSTWDTVLPRGSNPDNMMDTGKGLAKFPYIRGTRRIIGLDHFRLMSRYFVDTVNPENPPTSYRFFDSVGIGNYAVDIHPIKNSAGISPSLEKAAPFYIPYRALASANVRNLLVAGKLIATTYITNAAYRLHPVEWAAGSAAGTAAGLMSRDNLNNSAIMDPPHLQELRDTVSENSPIHWAAYDSSASTGQNGDLVVNDFMPVRAAVPFSMEIYHHRATRAVVEINGVAAGETTQKSNGRLIANNLMAPGGTVQITVICYDGEGNQLDILQRSLEVDDSVIYDDSDPEFNSSGSWTTASAQPDKYLTSYRYSFGSYPPSSAKWNFIVPAPGTYEVSIWYPESSNRATDSPFTVTHAEGNSTIIINQQLNGGRWVILGNFRFAGAPGEGVSLSNSVGDPAKLVVADAIRLRAVSAAKISNWNLY